MVWYILGFMLFGLLSWLLALVTEGEFVLGLGSVACLILATVFFILVSIEIEESRNDYYKERVPNLEQILKDYEIQQLENEILELKEGGSDA